MLNQNKKRDKFYFIMIVFLEKSLFTVFADYVKPLNNTEGLKIKSEKSIC